MKRILTSLFALIAMGGSVMAGDKPVITVADVEALPGETVSFTVNLTDGKADTYTAMTLYAIFPTTGFTTTGSPTIASAWTAATGSVGAIDPTTGLATIPLASENSIPGSAVDNLVTVSFTVASTLDYGEYTVTLQATMFEYNQSDKDYADDVTFKVKVVNRITLDENSTLPPVAREGVNVKVVRTIKANEWSTVCLPFAMNLTKAKAAFGDDVQVRKYANYTAVIDEITRVPSAITLNFTNWMSNALQTMQAGTPYLIKTSQDIEYFEVDNVNVIATTSSVSGEETNYGLPGYFKGTLAKTKVPNKCLFISGNKFYYSTGKTTIMAFRGWFELDAILNEAVQVGAPIYMSFDGEGTTAIDGVRNLTEEVRGEIYDLNGRRVETPSKGVYVVNGRKVVIK